MTIEDSLRQALADRAASVALPPERWAEVERRAASERVAQRRRGRRLRLGGLAAVGLAAAVTAAALLPGLHNDATQVRIHPAGSGPAATATGTGPSGTAGPAGSVPAVRSPSSPTSPAPGYGFSYQLLYPFRSLAEANSWQAAYLSGGQQPWHLDPAQTALSFSSGYLGYHDITTAFGTRTDATGAHVSVGFPNPNGQPVVSAVIHLRRFGAGANAPWEVVGTDDSDFTMTMPAYGALVTSPFTMGGVITGVDENIRVLVRQLSSTSPLAVTAGRPAGGTVAPWKDSVRFQGATDGVITIAASTGGHLATVERFTVTAARTSAAAPTLGP